MDKMIDIILFGASGFTGQSTIKRIDELTNGRTLTWAVAGRNEQKLKLILKEIGKKIGKDLSKISIIIADINDASSLERMTGRGRVIINTCGPYRLYGEAVIKACLKTGTHHVDVSGEIQFMEGMQLKYHKAAQEKGIYIISACGLASIPVDMGITFLYKKFIGTINSVESYLEVEEQGERNPGASFNISNFESAMSVCSVMYIIAYKNELRKIREKLNTTQIPTFQPKLVKKGFMGMHHSKLTNKLTFPLNGCDHSVVLRSQKHFYEFNKSRPIQLMTYISFKSVFSKYAIIMGVIGVMFLILANFGWGRKLMLKYPDFFTNGECTVEGPSDEKRENTSFIFTLFASGWAKRLLDVGEQFNTPPDKTMVVKISGVDPAYGVPSIALGLSAIVILEENNKMPDRGGVFTPAAAFSETTFIEQLYQHGLKFEIIQS